MKFNNFILLVVTLLLQICTPAFSNKTDQEALFGTSPRTDLNFMELCKYDGYKCENHTVITEDGYILSVFRLPRNENCSNDESRSPIIFMHGLYLTGDDCIIAGPGRAHCYIYNNACYDVWVPNNRGNRYSRNHIFLNPDKDSQFWDFAVEEIAALDTPAVIDYVLNQTKKEKVIYVAHSQGVTALILLCAKQPEYNDKIEMGFGLSTTAWLDNSRFVVVQLTGVIAPVLTNVVNAGVNGELLRHGGLTNMAGSLFCSLTTLSYPLCSVFLFAVLGYNKFQISEDVLPVVVSHIPGGTSIKNFNRWGQIRKNGFTEYDYGVIGNLKEYKQLSPPEFDLSAVTMKWVFISSFNDYVGDPRDIKKLVSKLSNAKQCILDDETFAHLDFVYGKDIPNYITPKIFSALASGEPLC